MSSWRGTTVATQLSENGPRAKCDQVVFEAIAKAAEIIVGSRCWIEDVHNGSGSGNSGSSRFNLLVPEVQGVRSILQRWKRALHVPLRLDVYYQHPDQRRELLERWCLEYAPSEFQQRVESFSADPIVQLRHVCKKIVIWLRTLYSWSRMLPSQTLRGTTIGFSIYVVSEGNDDVSSLVSSQGFLSQAQPSSVITPYGELGWKVFYAPKSMVQRFTPHQPPYKSEARPIPTQAKEHFVARQDSAPLPLTVQSAPKHGHARTYQRSHSTVAQTSSPLHHQLDPLRRRAGTNAGELMTPQVQNNDGGKPPPRPLSGLSLAMMMSDEISDADNEDKDSKNTTTTNQAEKRRAALHHAPPHLLKNNTDVGGDAAAGSPILKKSLTSAGEYGYAYNCHIPWQQIRPSTNAATNNRMSPFDSTIDRTASPSPLHGTPPGVLGATPPKSGFLSGGAITPPINPASLIPPRSTVTPPFVRPMGFVGEAPSQPLPQAALHTSNALQQQQQQQQQGASTTTSRGRNSGDPLYPATSLDLLHSSPFQQPPVGSILSSVCAQDLAHTASALNGGELRYHPEAAFHAYDDHYHHHQYDDNEEMPFAVDSPPEFAPSCSNATTTASATTATTSYLASSAAVASFAQRCANANRLAVFDSLQQQQHSNCVNTSQQAQEEHQQQQQEQPLDMVSSLADQLAEFKKFGESLMSHQKNVSDSGDAGSTSTPISLRS